MRGVAGIELGDILPACPAHHRNRPERPGRDVERPFGAAMRMNGRGDFLAGEIDPVGGAAAGTEHFRLGQVRRAKRPEAAGDLQLTGVADDLALPVMDRVVGDAAVDDRKSRDVDVEVGDAGAGERDRPSAAVGDRVARRGADLMIDQHAHRG